MYPSSVINVTCNIFLPRSLESCLPTRPNDIHLFYQCVSRVMVAVVGDASTGTQEAGVVNGILGNTQTPLNGDIIGSGVMNR